MGDDNAKSDTAVAVNSSNLEEKFNAFSFEEITETNSLNSPGDLNRFSNFPLRKKKKKKVSFNINELEGKKEYHDLLTVPGGQEFDSSECIINVKTNKSSTPTPSDGTKNKNSDISEMSPDSYKVDLDINFDFSTKKKRSKYIRRVQEDCEDFQKSEKKTQLLDMLLPSADSDYTYEYMLSRVYNISELERPNTDSNSAMKIVLKPPQILRLGSKKTVFANLLDICRSLRRTPKHVISFILTELGTCGSVDANNHLVIKGRFQQNQIANIVRRYAMEYVKCATCNSMNTIMQKHVRLDFLICENCNSQRSVTVIKSGFQALTSRRAAVRAKTST